MNDWKVQIARILGEPTTTILQDYYGSDLAGSLKVNDERLLTFYDYLRDELTFPFTAIYKAFEVTCKRLDQEMNVDEVNGIRLFCERDNEEIIIPLTEIVVDEADANFSSIKLYQNWIQRDR